MYKFFSIIKVQNKINLYFKIQIHAPVDSTLGKSLFESTHSLLESTHSLFCRIFCSTVLRRRFLGWNMIIHYWGLQSKASRPMHEHRGNREHPTTLQCVVLHHPSTKCIVNISNLQQNKCSKIHQHFNLHNHS